MSSRILIVEDEPSLAELYCDFLAGEPVEITLAINGAQAEAALSANQPDLMLLDVRLPDIDGLTFLRELRARGETCEVVVITAHGSVTMAVEAMRAGAYDFIIKPFTAERLIYTVRNALERRNLTRMVESLRADLGPGRDNYFGFIGSSLAMQGVYRAIEAAARSKATVFITGESGTGKELCAEALHKASPRAGQPFVALNCAAIPRDLMESEIFGHAKGAFTGAVENREGAASRANGGTLFLDEVCEMAPELQSKLLRFIQTGNFQKVGGANLERADIRFVCATNRDPLAEVAAGRFREDLFYRLHVIPIHLPPLRERESDVIKIANHLLRQISHEEQKSFRRFTAAAEACLKAYDWPGNVRQLANAVRNIVVMNAAEEATVDMLPPPLPRRAPQTTAISFSHAETSASAREIRPLWEVERDAIESAIARCGGNVAKAAALLGISPSTIYRKKAGWDGAAAGLSGGGQRPVQLS